MPRFAKRLQVLTRVVPAVALVLAGPPRLPAQSAQPVPSAVTLLTLTRDTVIDGFPCGPTGRARAEVHGNGRLSECPVPRDTVLSGHRFPRASWPRFTDRGVLVAAWLSQDVRLQGVPCKGTGYKAWAVGFHPNGRLSLCYLSEAAVIDGVPCQAAWFWRELTGTTQLQLYPDGRLRSCRLSRAVTLNGARYKKGQRFTRPESSPTPESNRWASQEVAPEKYRNARQQHRSGAR
jgi:hypothetical protein